MSALYVFDAYGTLFDVHSAVARHADDVGPQAARLSDLWRIKQLEYTWVRSLAGRYADFQDLTEESLDYAAQRCGGINALTRANRLVLADTGHAATPEGAAQWAERIRMAEAGGMAALVEPTLARWFEALSVSMCACSLPKSWRWGWSTK